MMLKLILAAAATVATAGPALAGPTPYQPTAQDFRDGTCTRQQGHVPAGKIVHAPPIVRCDQAALANRAADASARSNAITDRDLAEGGAAR